MRQLPRPEEAFAPEVVQQLQIALAEIGPIEPWWDQEFEQWMFESPLYTEAYYADDKQEVIIGYPLHLCNLLSWRMDGNLDSDVEARITGKAGINRGGARAGAGRPKGSLKPVKIRVSLPHDIAAWLKDDHNISRVRQLMQQAS